MPYVFKRYHLSKEKRAFVFLMDKFHITMAEAQKIIDRGRLRLNGEIIKQKGSLISGNNIEVLVFEAKSRGLKPIFEREDFAVFLTEVVF